jgi:PRC-barrel domain
MPERAISGKAAAALAAIVLLPAVAQAQSSGAGIVEEALQGVQQDQERDSKRVKEIVEEAVKGAEQAPSGQEAINPMAPDTLRPLPPDAQASLPAGYRADDMVGKPVVDGTGAKLGVIRGLVIDDVNGVARAMVEFAPLFGKPGKVTAIAVDTLTTGAAPEGGYVMSLTSTDFDKMPAYAWANLVWQRVAG